MEDNMEENTLSDAIERLEQAKNILDDVQLRAENRDLFDLAEVLRDYMGNIQEIIDSLTDL